MHTKYAIVKKASKKKAVKKKMASKITKKKKSVIKKKKRVSKPKPKKNYGSVIQDANLNHLYYIGGYAVIFGVFAVAIYFSQ
jgi:hypothetical protein